MSPKPPMNVNPRELDAEYQGFPPFSEWSKCAVDTVRWDRYTGLLKQRGEISPDHLRRARNIVTRAAAIDTGAIEALYQVDRGFTYTVAAQAATWEATLGERDPETTALIESRRDAYELVLDFATRNRPIAEAWIR